MTSDRTTPPALPFFLCSPTAAAALVLHVLVRLHDQPQRFGSGSAIDMRCRRRPRLGMGWLRSMLSPLRKLWCRVNAVQQRKKRGIYILYDDVKSCQCEDVHVLWSILVESHGLPPPTPLPSPPVLSGLKRRGGGGGCSGRLPPHCTPE